MKSDEKIDLVYLWVNGNDEEWQKEKEQWANRLNVQTSSCINYCRFAENEELKYSLRSVSMNAPWINHIFIVTNGQVPSWLNTKHEKITIVTHSEIMPSEALPTFNSEAIETCIANISDLSEYFLYANDDMFINNPITPDYFFDKHNKPIIRMNKLTWSEKIAEEILFCKNVIYSKNLIKSKYKKDFKYTPSHNIEPYRKSYCLECKNIFKEEFEQTSLQKFRKGNSIQRSIQNYYVLATKGVKRKEVDNRSLYLPLININRIRDKVIGNSPLLLCINDCEQSSIECRNGLKKLLLELYNKPAEWEIQTDESYQIEPIFENSRAKTIVFSPDNNFCKYFSVALQSLIENSKNYEDYDIIILDKDLSERNKKIIQKMLPPNFKLRYYDINKYIFEKLGKLSLKPKDHWSISMYYRIFIPLIMQKYQKVLYCDSDICINNSISDLFEIDIEDKNLLVIKDEITQVLENEKNFKKHILENLKLNKPNEYFNSGIIMFNIQSIDLNNYLERFKTILETTQLKYPDQDILNKMYENKIKFISWTWNFQYHVDVLRQKDYNYFTKEFSEDYFKSQNNPHIIHYTSSQKPWHSPNNALSEIFWRYARHSPFYEEILYTNLKSKGISENTLKIINQKGKIYYQYYRTKILSFLSFGKTKQHYLEKKKQYKSKIKEIRKFSNL